MQGRANREVGSFAFWGAIVNVTLPKDLDKAINWVMPETATKSWRDPEINGQRLLVQYYNY